MSKSPKSFEVYGFTIEVHSGGRRVWPPSFKRFVKTKIDAGELTVAEVMKTCDVSQSLIYKWRSDVKASRKMTKTVSEERLLSEIIIEDEVDPADASSVRDRIHLTTGKGTLDFPAAYPVDDLVKIILAVNAQP